MWIAILIVLIVVLVAVLLKIAHRARTAAQIEPSIGAAQLQAHIDTANADAVPFATEATRSVAAECFRLAFSVAQFDYQISGEHAAVLDSVGACLDESVHERDYFPRRPMLLPKLLQAINDSESTRKELVSLILEDPTLAGAVLQRANSAYYRLSPEPVESLDRAVFMLGTDGLRRLMATAILQPVFHVPRGYFDNFADITWEQAERTAIAAEAHARAGLDTEPIVARLLGMLSLLANIVLFRITMDKYREHPNVLPRAEVFIKAIQLHRARIAGLVAQTWQLTDMSITAFTEQQQQIVPSRLSSLGRCLYFGDLCGAQATLAAHGSYPNDAALALLVEQGADRETARSMWRAAASIHDR